MKEIPLTQGKAAIVDDWQFDLVGRVKWYARRSRSTFYAARTIKLENGKRAMQLMHRIILPGYSRVDHRDRNGLNNQDHNLRPSTPSTNACNAKKRAGTTSRFKGVYRHQGKWMASIRVLGRSRYIGMFHSDLDAARAYDMSAIAAFGEYALTNSALGLLP